MMSYGSRFLCVSEFIRQQALKKGFPAEKLLLHYTGVDTNFFAPDRAIARAPVVLFVGRLNPAKGLEYLIHAMASIQRVIPIAKLVVIGEGPQRSELEGLAGANIDNFIFLGVQPPAVVKYWMNRAKVFSSPCYVTSTDQEGFGMTFAEAQAMGLPVVSCSIGGIPEAVAHDQSGFLVPQRDWEALVPKLLLLLQNQDLWNTFSEAGMARVQKLFNIRTQATRLERTYESVLTGWNSRPYETS
jgi:glycosyltransferase involved in cell wall biosynthesis